MGTLLGVHPIVPWIKCWLKVWGMVQYVGQFLDQTMVPQKNLQ